MVRHVIFDLDQTLLNSDIAYIDRKRREWKQVYSKIPMMYVFNGVFDLLSYIKKNDITFSVFTSSPGVYCSKVLNHFRIFPEIVIAFHDVSKRKPNPEGIIKIINQLNINANEILSVGDHENDIIASQRAGVISVGVLWGNFMNDNLINSKPDYIVSDPKEIIEIITKHNSKSIN